MGNEGLAAWRDTTASANHRVDHILLAIVDEAVRFHLHASCLASVREGCAGDRLANAIVDRVKKQLGEVK